MMITDIERHAKMEVSTTIQRNIYEGLYYGKDEDKKRACFGLACKKSYPSGI